MYKLEFQDILKGLKEGTIKPSDIIELIETKQLNHLYEDEIEEIILSFEKDEDKIPMLKHVFAPIRIIRTFNSEENILKALGELKSDEEKLKVASRFINDEENRLKAIEMFEDKNKAFFIKLMLSREAFKTHFLGEENKKYEKIGLDKDITAGIEIETIGKNSEKILEAGEKNGTIIHKEKGLECGRILKRGNEQSWITMRDGSLIIGERSRTSFSNT